MKFNRIARLRFERPPFADSEAIEGLRIMFRIERLALDAYHKMELKIYNLSMGKERWTSGGFFDSGDIVTLEAGYEGNVSVVFRGVISNVFSSKEDTDMVTTMLCLDNNPNGKSMVNFNAKKQTSIVSVIHDIANSIGIEIAEISISPKNLTGAISFSKEFSEEMDILAKTHDLIWFIYNSRLYVYDNKRSVFGASMQIDESSGLLESPVITEKGVNVKMLLEPSVKANDTYVVLSGGVQDSRGALYFAEREKISKAKGGTQRVLSVVHTGDTHGTPWYTELTGLRA